MTTPITRHFDLCTVAALARIEAGVATMIGSREQAHAQFPFLAELAASLQRSEPGTWDDAVAAFEATTTEHLPLRALAQTYALDPTARAVLVAVGLPEDDARFGALYDALQPTPDLGRPTPGTLLRWWAHDAPDLRQVVQRLLADGLLEAVQPDAPAALQPLRVPPALWSALRGDPLPPGPVGHRPLDTLRSLGTLLLAPDVYTRLLALLPLHTTGGARTLIVRGPPANGRRTLLAAVARRRGLGVLEVDATRLRPEDPTWRGLGALAVALHAMPVIRLDPGPGERVRLHEPARGPVGVVLGAEGSLEGPFADAALTLALPIPPPEIRRMLWQRSTGLPDDALDLLAARHRLPAGTIVHTAANARLLAAARKAVDPALADVAAACADMPKGALDLLAVRVPVHGDWSAVSLPPETMQELRTLESRCLRRELLPARTGPALRPSLGPGVRALLQGPSGTGKTLAARTLAAVLGKQLYRVELATVINKYIGETEKNLHLVFSLAEALDVVLLLDEGDALLARRTTVQSSNDRYANLETNYLLQRIETFQGVLVITTNAAEHIDSAFLRRMDVVVDFRPPELAERDALWRLHLPERHAVDPLYLREVVARCALLGGQIRNVALHATLLALAEAPDAAVTGRHLEDAVLREYRKTGTVCPLPRRSSWPDPQDSRPGPADHAWTLPPGVQAKATSAANLALNPTRVLPRVPPDPDPKNPWGYPVIGGLCLKADDILPKTGDFTLALDVVLPLPSDAPPDPRRPIVGGCQLNSESWQLVLDDTQNFIHLELRHPTIPARPLSTTHLALAAPTRGAPLRLVLAKRGDVWLLPAGPITPPYPITPTAGHLWIGAGVILGGNKLQTFFDGLIIIRVALWLRALTDPELAAARTGPSPR